MANITILQHCSLYYSGDLKRRITNGVHSDGLSSTSTTHFKKHMCTHTVYTLSYMQTHTHCHINTWNLHPSLVAVYTFSRSVALPHCLL